MCLWRIFHLHVVGFAVSDLGMNGAEMLMLILLVLWWCGMWGDEMWRGLGMLRWLNAELPRLWSSDRSFCPLEWVWLYRDRDWLATGSGEI